MPTRYSLRMSTAPVSCRSPGVNGKLIVDAICETREHPDVYYIPEQSAIPRVLRSIANPKDTVLTMGAGDISRVGEELLEIL